MNGHVACDADVHRVYRREGLVTSEMIFNVKWSFPRGKVNGRKYFSTLTNINIPVALLFWGGRIDINPPEVANVDIDVSRCTR